MDSNEHKKLEDIHERVIRIEEHLKNQNGKVFKNMRDIEEITKKISPLTNWYKIQTVVITLLAGTTGYLIKFALDIVSK